MKLAKSEAVLSICRNTGLVLRGPFLGKARGCVCLTHLDLAPKLYSNIISELKKCIMYSSLCFFSKVVKTVFSAPLEVLLKSNWQELPVKSTICYLHYISEVRVAILGTMKCRYTVTKGTMIMTSDLDWLLPCSHTTQPEWWTWRGIDKYLEGY